MRHSHYPQTRTTQPPARTHATAVPRRVLAVAAALLSAAGIATAATGAAGIAVHPHGAVANRPPSSSSNGSGVNLALGSPIITQQPPSVPPGSGD